MKFCMVTTFYPPYHFGGDATYVRALSRALVRRGHEVTVVHCEDAYALRGSAPVESADEEEGITVHRLKSAAGVLSPIITQQAGIPGLKSAALRKILAAPFDVVNFHNVSLVGGPGVLSLSNAPINLYTLHEHWLVCPTHIFWKNRREACDKRQCFRCSIRSGIPPQLWRYGPFVGRALEAIDLFLSPSEYTARRHAQLLPVADRIAVLPLFAARPSLDAQSVAQRSGRFLFVGRLTPAKGITALLESFARWPEHGLDVVGEGELSEMLRSRFAAHDNIRFLGALPQGDLGRLYREAAALVMPSLAPETFGLTIVEAFAHGTPAIVRVAGGNREAVDASGAGILYEDEGGLRAALDQIAGDPQATSRLGERAREAFEAHYTEDLHVDGYLANIETVRQRKEKQALLR